MKTFISKQFVVGLVVFFGIVIFLVFTFIIGQNRGTFLRPVNTYKSVYKEAKGIFTGSEVSIHGVRTGNVIKTEFLKDGHVQVIFTSRKKHHFVINQSTVSQLKYQGVLGDRYISLATNDFSLNPLPSNSVIPSIPSEEILDLFSKSDEFKNSAQLLVSELSQFIASLNNRKTVENLNAILSPKNKKKISEILETTHRILKKVDSGQGTLGALINNRSLYNRLLNVLGVRKGHDYMEELSKKSKKK